MELCEKCKTGIMTYREGLIDEFGLLKDIHIKFCSNVLCDFREEKLTLHL